MQRVPSVFMQWKSDGVMRALMTWKNMVEIMWNWEKVTWKVQKMLCWMMMAEIKWMLLTVVFIGKDKTQWGMVRSSSHIRCRWKNILIKLPGVIGQTKNSTVPFETWKCPVQIKLKITFFNTKIGIFLLSNLLSAMTVMPNSQTKLR